MRSNITLEDMTDELFEGSFSQEFFNSIDQKEHDRYYRDELSSFEDSTSIESMRTLIFSTEHEGGEKKEKGKEKEGGKEKEEEEKLKGAFLGAPTLALLNGTINGLREGLSNAEMKILTNHITQINALKKDFGAAKTDEKKISVNKHVLRIVKATVSFLEKSAKLSEQTLDKVKDQYKENLKLYTVKTKRLEKGAKAFENLLKKYEAE